MPYAAPIELVQAAATRVGELSVTSLEDGSMPSRVAKANYEGMARRRLAMHAWSWAKLPVALVQQGERSVGRYRWAHLIPPQAIRVHWVGRGLHRIDDWSIDDGKILTAAPGPWEALITRRAPESDWSADFAEAFITDLEALFIMSLVRNPQDARMRQRDAEVAFRTAIAADRRQSPGPKIETGGRLVEAWIGLRPVGDPTSSELLGA